MQSCKDRIKKYKSLKIKENENKQQLQNRRPNRWTKPG